MMREIFNYIYNSNFNYKIWFSNRRFEYFFKYKNRILYVDLYHSRAEKFKFTILINFNIKCNFIKSIRIILNYNEFIKFMFENDLKILSKELQRNERRNGLYSFDDTVKYMNHFISQFQYKRISSDGFISKLLKHLIKLKHDNINIINRFKFWNRF